MIVTRWWGTCLLLFSMVLASPTPSMDTASDFIQSLARRQDSGNNSGGNPSNTSRTTIIFASVLGGFLAIFVTFSLLSILRSKFGMRMPSIPMPDPPPYLSILRFGRRNPEDGPPLPVYMEQPDGSTTVLQRSESRRSESSRAPSSPMDDVPIISLPRPPVRAGTRPEPPPYMKDPPPFTPSSPTSSMPMYPMPTPPPSDDGHDRSESGGNDRESRAL